MKQIIKTSMLALLLISGAAQRAQSCTSAIVSGKATPDGRPILWKSRDTDNLKNCVRHFNGEKYDYVAVTAYDRNPRSAWIGTNSAGFAIMNTLSYNLVEDDGKNSSAKRNGATMKRALEICGSVADFRNFLDTLSRPMQVSSNFGVIDAQGNACYFEVNGTRYTEYDVNDPRVAPHGYIVRTNYSFSGKDNDGGGHIRYQEAHNKLYNAVGCGEVSPRWFITNLSRSFHNPLMGIDLKSGRFNRPETNGWFVEQDFIARKSTSCAVAVQGVRKDEAPELTTMWTVMGYPPVTPIIPVWVKGGDRKLPAVLTTTDFKTSPLCDRSNALRRQVYSYRQGNLTENYFNWEKLFNKAGTGWMQLTEEVDNKYYPFYERELNKWREAGSLPVREVHNLYDLADSYPLQYLTNQ